jgi:hypothetical protein
MLAVALNKRPSSRRFPCRLAAGGAALLLAAAAFSCGRPFNVNTKPNLPPASYAAKATVDSVAVQAQAITDEDFLYDTFDANLISAGVLPVRVMLTNSEGETVNCKNARFEIEAQSRRFKAADARKAFKRLISYYGISVYSKSGYKESLEAFASYALDVGTPLAGAQSRQGLVFFLVPAEAARQAGLTLVIGKLNSKQPDGRAGVSLKLN